MHLSNGFRKYTQNTGYLLFGKIAKLLATFTVGVCLIRYLGPRQFGLFSYAISFVFLFNALANLGLDSIIVRDLVNSKDKDEILGSAFVLKLIGAVSTIVIILITINFASFNLYTKGMICVISLGMLFKSVDVIDFYFQSEVLSKYVVYAQVVSLVITSVLYLAFIYFRLPLMYFAYVFLFEFLVTSVGLLVCYKINKQKVILWKANLNRMKGLLKDSWPVIFTGLAIMVYMRIDQIMIKEMLGLEAVGHYAAAVRLSEAWHFIPLVITTSLFPAIIKAKSVSNSFYVARVQKLYDLLIWLSIIVALSTAFLSNWLVQLLYGQRFSEAGVVLAIHIWAGVFISYGLLKARWMVNENIQWYGGICTFSGAISNVILNIFLIKRYGILGAALATVISQGISGIIVPIFYNRDRKSVIFFLRSFNPVRVLNLS